MIVAGSWRLHTATMTGLRLWTHAETGQHRLFGVADAPAAAWNTFLVELGGGAPAARPEPAVTPEELADLIWMDSRTLRNEDAWGNPGSCGAKRQPFERRPDIGWWSLPCARKNGHAGPHETQLGDQFEDAPGFLSGLVSPMEALPHDFVSVGDGAWWREYSR